jgi:aspartate racemase
MIVEVNRAMAERGLSRVGILGTRTVMETRFYGGVTWAEIIPPGGQDLLDVHQAYVAMAASGVVTEAQRSVFDAASHRLFKDKGAQAILLGGLILCWCTMREPPTSR